MKRVFLIVLDSVGVGNAPDAKAYNDYGSNTWGHVLEFAGDYSLPTFEALGINNILKTGRSTQLIGSYGVASEVSSGKDTTTGHWELAGLELLKPFPTYKNGFPKDVIDEFSAKTGRGVLANKPASGTAVIDEFGEEHMKTGSLIVYTSADSVFQIAAHEDIVSNEELYRYCNIARDMLQGEHGVGRVIARPFIGEPGNFTRTGGRRDFSLEPFSDTMLNHIGRKMEAIGVGKIGDIFCESGLTQSLHVHGNSECMPVTIELMDKDFEGLVFTNLVDFDMNYGHRNNPQGYYDELIKADAFAATLFEKAGEDDLFIFTADHGCDPTYPGTDHTREMVPILMYGSNIKAGVDIGQVSGFYNIAATIMDYLGVEGDIKGESFLAKVIKG